MSAKRMNKKWEKNLITIFLILVAAAIMLLFLIKVTNASGKEITAFEDGTDLGAKVAEQGCAEEELGLPETLSVTLGDGIAVTMTIPEGAFDIPLEELTLSAKVIEDEAAKVLLEQEVSADDGEGVMRNTMLFDINVMHGEEVVQPKKPVQVSFSGITAPKNDVQVYHVDTDAEAVEEMSAEKEENGDITMEAPHFSIYGVTFTVDFHNGDITFSIAGESEVMLSAIFEKLGIERSAADAVSVEFSNPELISVENDGDDWKLTSLKSFETEEELTITFQDGEVYKIRVTDPTYVTYVNGFPQLAPTDKVAVINETTNEVLYRPSLSAAMTEIAGGIAGTSYTVVFTQDYTSTQADWGAVANNGAQAQKITFTSTYNDGTSDVRSGLTMLADPGAAHSMSTETEFKNLSFLHGNTYPRIFARGHKLTMGEGISNSFAGGYGLQLFGGSSTANAASSDITVLSGSYGYIFAGGSTKAVTGTGNLFIGGTAEVVYAIPSNLSIQTPASARYNLTIDGSQGAKVENVYASYKAMVSGSNSAVLAGAIINTTIRSMKDIVLVDLSTETSASGKLTVEGDVQIQKKLWTNKNRTDVELVSGAVLTTGSNGTESVAGTDDYAGRLHVGRDLLLNTDSKLIFAGNGVDADGSHMVERNINVKGSGAEIHIFKSETTTYPLTIQGTGAYVGTETLKLGIHKDPKKADTMNGCMSDIFLSFHTANNAKTENYTAGEGIDGILKSGGNITADRFLDDPIDVGIGWVQVGAENPYHDASDPASEETCTIQYVGGSDSPYARDKKVAASYTLTGTNNDDYKTWPISRGKVTVTENTTAELILDNVSMEGAETKAFEVSYANTTFTLKDGSTNNFKVLFAPNNVRKNEFGDDTFESHYGGIIGKNGMSGTLTMRCEHSDEPGHRCLKNGTCGVFIGNAVKGKHSPVIGSYLRRYDPNLPLNDGGFSNLYIEGGIYDLKASVHNAAIGTTCFLWRGNSHHLITLLNKMSVYLYSPAGSPASRGEMCKNINISKARIFASCDTNCAPGIGAGYGGMVDGITIADGAYVYAKGGDYAPGIGSGSANSTGHPEKSAYAFHVKNIKVTGGDTVVEAIGGKGLADQGVTGSEYMPGIGVGGSNQSPGYHDAGNFTNVYAEPEDGYSAIIKQGTAVDPAQAVYIDGSPSAGRLDVIVNQPYTLIFFSKIGKTASVNGEPDNAGSPAAPVAVSEGDEVRYKIDLGSVIENNNTVTGTVSDSLPAGMTLVETPGTFTPGMTWSTDPSTGVTAVTWINQTFTAANKDFYFTVTVDNLPAGVIARDYINETAKATFVSNGKTVTIPAGITYHHLDKDPGVEFVKVNESGEPISGAGFTIFACTNRSQGHAHTDGTCSWDAAKPLKTEVVSGTDGKVEFTGFSLNKQYIMVETTVPAGMKDPDTNSYIVVNVAADGTYTMTGVGYFAENGVLSYEQGTGTYTIQNAYELAEISLKKTISNYADYGTALKDYEFIVNISGDLIASTSLKHGETSKTITHIVDGPSDTINISEIVPMEFAKTYRVAAEITHADGTKKTKTGKTVEVKPGDKIVITVTNTFAHEGYFKNRTWVENRFTK